MKYAVLLPVAAGVTADPEWIGEGRRLLLRLPLSEAAHM